MTHTHPAPVLGGGLLLDRIGSGDAFAAGLIHGLLTGTTLERAPAYATTPGDVSMATLTEVEALIAGGSAPVRG